MSVERVLFLCTHNSARSQMAEGLLRGFGGDRFEVASAGTEARGVKTLERFLGQHWDHVITVCDSANESCPIFPGAAARLHWTFDDPSAATGSEEQRLAVFRRVRDEMRARIAAWLAQQVAAPGRRSA